MCRHALCQYGWCLIFQHTWARHIPPRTCPSALRMLDRGGVAHGRVSPPMGREISHSAGEWMELKASATHQSRSETLAAVRPGTLPRSGLPILQTRKPPAEASIFIRSFGTAGNTAGSLESVPARSHKPVHAGSSPAPATVPSPAGMPCVAMKTTHSITNRSRLKRTAVGLKPRDFLFVASR